MTGSNALSEEQSDESKDYNNSVPYTVYILRTSSNTLYIGQTNNLDKRLLEHKNKTSKSAKYIKYFDSFQLVYSEEYGTRIEALKREYQIKQWTKAKKEVLIAGDSRLKKQCSFWITSYQ